MSEVMFDSSAPASGRSEYVPPTPGAERAPTGEEVARSLTGWDEQAIKRHFGPSADWDGPTSLRAMAFVLKRREGLPDMDAYGQVMGMQLGDVQGMFSVAEKAEGKA